MKPFFHIGRTAYMVSSIRSVELLNVNKSDELLRITFTDNARLDLDKYWNNETFHELAVMFGLDTLR